MVADEWVSATLGNLIQNKEVSVQTGPFGTVLSASEYVKHGIPVISVREIRKGFIKVFDETPCVSEETYNKLQTFALQPYDLIFARKGNVERSALVPDDGNKYFLGSDGIRLRFLNNQLAKVILYLLQTNQIQQFIYNNSYGSTLAGLNESIISSIPVSYPSRENEQTNIARILSDNDSLISSLEKLLAKKKAIKQGAMQELLTGKRRLPGFADAWTSTLVRDCGSFLSGGTPSKQNPDWWNGRIPWISSSDLYEDCVDNVSITRFITEEAINHSATKLCPASSVLIVSRVGVGKVAVAPCDLCTSQDFVTLVPEYDDPRFIALLLSNIMKDEAQKTQGTSIKGITSDHIGVLEIKKPRLSEQRAIADLLFDMANEIKELEQKLTKYRQVKRGIMQQLLTGKIRLIDSI